jgi:hypothetical protein
MKKELENIEQRIRCYQKFGIWQPAYIDYKGWINNFKTKDEKKIAYLLLNFFLFFPSNMVDRLLIHSFNLSRNLLQNHIPKWSDRSIKEKCYFSYIPGEIYNPTDSGHRYVTKIRNLLNLDQEMLIDYKDIPNILDFNKEPIAIIFVDDFIGTGNQCVKAWTKNSVNQFSETLQDISNKSNHIFIYNTLIANSKGYRNIKNNCKNLNLFTTHILGDEYNIFNKKCFCWQGDEDLYKRSISMILEISTRIGIPNREGKYPVDVKGFASQGLALAIEEAPPDAVPAIFYWCQNGWTPLVKRNYVR